MSEPVPVLVPRQNANDDHAVVVRWYVESGAQVEADQRLATLETTKAAFEVCAPVAGYVFFEHAVKSLVAVGAPLAWISERAEPLETGTQGPAELCADGGPRADGSPRFTRKALKLMRQRGLSEADFAAAGRVDAAEVERRVRDVDELPQTPSKILEAARLQAVYAEVVPSTVTMSVSAAGLARRLRRLADRCGPVTLLEAAIHDVARTLRGFPDLNGYYANGAAFRYTSINIGFAVNLGRALRVPVVRRADALSFVEIASAVRDLSLRYMREALAPQDVADGTFTITDLSSREVVHFIPVLNHRQAAILALCDEWPGTGQRELVLTFDHRMSDGMQAAGFLLKLRERLLGAMDD